MSISALLLGVEARLRSAAVLDDQPDEPVGAICGVQPDGKPPNNAGQFYYAVHFLGMRNDDPNSLSDDWFLSVGVTITARMGYAPKDRKGKRMTVAQDLFDRATAVAKALNQDDLHRIEANKLITGTAEWVAVQDPSGTASVNGFLEPLRFANISEARPAPAGWVGSATETDVYTVVVTFRDAHRPQLLS